MSASPASGSCGCGVPLTAPFLLSHDGTDSPPDAGEVVVVLNNFKSKIIKVKVSLVNQGSRSFIVVNRSRTLAFGRYYLKYVSRPASVAWWLNINP